MKLVDKKGIDTINGKQLGPADSFQFRCHAGVSCFNKCCKNQNIYLYPYDIVRLKNALNITSEVFIDTYVDVVLRKGNHFPDVLLKMSDEGENACPFLEGEHGCGVYEDRPGTCRLFPMELGVAFDNKARPDALFFFRPPEFCRGVDESNDHTLDTWRDDQGVDSHIRMNLRWAEVNGLFANNPWGHEGPGGRNARIAFMAAYNVDSFRAFLFNSSFFKKYKVKPDVKKKIKRNDTELMKFGFAFIRYSFFGIPSTQLKAKH